MSISIEGNVLVTAIGTAAATSIVQELKRSIPGIRIIGTDTNNKDQIVTSREVDEFYHFPSCVENRGCYLDFLADFCRGHQVRYIFSTIDEEVYGLTQMEETFRSMGIRLCTADAHTVQTCHFKDLFSRWIRENIPRIAIPEYQDAADVPDEEYPLFVKPVEGRSSIGCEVIKDRHDAMLFYQHHDKKDFILQKYCTGDIVSVDIVRDRKHSAIKTCQKLETLRNRNGCGIAVEIVDDPVLEEICTELAVKLDLNGVVNAEFFKNGQIYKIIEVNPRFPAGTSYSCRAGLNIVLDAYRIANSEPVSEGLPQAGMKFARRYETYEC